MRLVFFGTSDFAIPSLKRVMESRHKLLAVVTQPDKRKGRGLIISPVPVKETLKDTSIPVHQPPNLSNQDIIDELRRYNADLFIVVAYGQILKEEVLNIPKRFCVNLHPSLLPKYRGGAPINWAIINGDKKSGATLIRMNKDMDAGDIILKREVDIKETDTGATLSERLSITGADLLLETLDLIEKDNIKFIKQDKKEATYAPMLRKEDGLIDWSMDAQKIHNRIRGLLPWPAAYTHLGGKSITIYKSIYNEKMLDDKDIGRVIRLDDNSIVIGTGKGELIIRELQLEGKRSLTAEEFLRGHKLKIGDKLL